MVILKLNIIYIFKYKLYYIGYPSYSRVSFLYRNLETARLFVNLVWFTVTHASGLNYMCVWLIDNVLLITVQITPASLPKGLHALNLSKNKISVIEGLRELTCLRVLDLSYNRISRIGQGKDCSHYTELYSCLFGSCLNFKLTHQVYQTVHWSKNYT